MEKRYFVVIGGKWFDKVNGNTYNTAKIIEPKTRATFYTQFTYGYGSSYLTEAIEELKRRGIENFDIIDGGSFYLKKADCKNGNF